MGGSKYLLIGMLCFGYAFSKENNSSGKIVLLKLHPTQFSVGMWVVNKKQNEFLSLSSKELEKYLKKNPVPVVVGPKNIFYMIDRHHMALSLWKAGIKKVRFEIIEDFSHLSYEVFWQTMTKKKWVYLYNQLGQGPYSVFDLPKNIISLVDDPYRSIAKEVRERGGYKKTSNPFSEFSWANYFRELMVLEEMGFDFEKAIRQALMLAHRSEASHLPGFLSKDIKCLDFLL